MLGLRLPPLSQETQGECVDGRRGGSSMVRRPHGRPPPSGYVAAADNNGWSLHGARWLQPVAAGTQDQ
jgi:hypothetical protein